MFAGFKLELDKDYSDYYELGLRKFNTQKTKIQNNLDKYINKDNFLNGSEIQKDWFPQIDADVFISHSHNDQKKAIGLAGWLYDKFELKVFIDSCIWGYCDNLLKMIDDEFCLQSDGWLYDYSKRNYSTSHVHNMLSIALTKMIDRTECLFFLNTPNSIHVSDIVSQTKSPWIYAEIAMTEMIRQKPLSEYRGMIKKADGYRNIYENKEINILYDVSLDHLHTISNSELQQWKANFTNLDYPLDGLYIIKKLLKYHNRLSG